MIQLGNRTRIVTVDRFYGQKALVLNVLMCASSVDTVLKASIFFLNFLNYRVK